MKRMLLLICVVSFLTAVNAQIQNTEVLFYIVKDASISNRSITVYMLKWENGKLYKPAGKYWCDNLCDVVDNIKEDNDFYEKLEWTRENAEEKNYDREMSNDKWLVYAEPFNAWYFYGTLMYPKHVSYYAFKRDLSEYMRWDEPDYSEKGRHTYRRVTKSELRSVNTKTRDFLQ